MRNILFALILATPLALAGEAGITLKPDTLRAEPFVDAKSVGNFGKGETVDILDKKGPWLQIKTKKSVGWVRLLSIKKGNNATSTNQTKGAIDVATGRAGTGKVVATTGIRGLSEEELKSAKFNEEEIQKLESFTLNNADGQYFAQSGNLKAVAIPYLKDTK